LSFKLLISSYFRLFIYFLRFLRKELPSPFIGAEAESHIPQSYQGGFIEIVENHLFSLHTGNIAVYKDREDEFKVLPTFL